MVSLPQTLRFLTVSIHGFCCWLSRRGTLLLLWTFNAILIHIVYWKTPNRFYNTIYSGAVHIVWNIEKCQLFNNSPLDITLYNILPTHPLWNYRTFCDPPPTWVPACPTVLPEIQCINSSFSVSASVISISINTCTSSLTYIIICWSDCIMAVINTNYWSAAPYNVYNKFYKPLQSVT